MDAYRDIIRTLSFRLLRVVLILLGILVLVLLLSEPHLEGRNVNATLFQIYFNDPFLAYIYLSSIPFFIGLHRAVRIVGNAARGTLNSPSLAADMRTIRNCALACAALFFGAIAFIFLAYRRNDDIAGGMAVGLFIVVSSLAVAGITHALERRLFKTSL